MRDKLSTIYISTLLVVAVSGPSLRASNIESLMTLGLPEKAAVLAKRDLQPGDPLLIKALCRAGQPESALEQWQNDNDSLEEICWAFLVKGKKSSQLFHRWVVMQLAADLHSYRSVPFILEALQDPNLAIRESACGLVPVMQDRALVQELHKIAAQDRELIIRLTAIKALASIQAKGAKEHMVFDEESLTEEKVAAITSLAILHEKVDAAEVKTLVSSPRAAMRLFAIELVIATGQKELFQLLLPLAKDTHPTVKMAFCEAAVILRQQRAPELLPDSDYRVEISAAWMRATYGQSVDQLAAFLQCENPKARALAAVALGKLGQKVPLKMRLGEERDLFARLNIAAALLPYDESAGKVLFEVLASYRGALMASTAYSPALPLLLPSDLPKRELMGQQDEGTQDLMVRMELLHQLACKNSPEALAALKEFLKEKRLGKATFASFVLLQEGDEETAKMVQQLLYDKDEELSLQAALLLGGLFSDPEALSVLKKGYDTADFETRLKILEALGRIGDKESLPFLQKQLKDPSLLVQLLSSWAIVSILNG